VLFGTCLRRAAEALGRIAAGRLVAIAGHLGFLAALGGLTVRQGSSSPAPNHVYIGERQPELAATDEAIDDNVRVEPWWGTQPTTANANCMRRPRALSK
jgi:hypothetical protein